MRVIYWIKLDFTDDSKENKKGNAKDRCSVVDWEAFDLGRTQLEIPWRRTSAAFFAILGSVTDLMKDLFSASPSFSPSVSHLIASF